MAVSRKKVALAAVAGLLIVSIIIPYIMAKRVTQELWHYFDSPRETRYILLAKISDKNGGIFGATNTVEPNAISDDCVPFSRSRHSVLLLKKVDTLLTLDDREYQWVSASNLIHAVHTALAHNRYRDIKVQSSYGASLLVDDRLLQALVKGNYENLTRSTIFS